MPDKEEKSSVEEKTKKLNEMSQAINEFLTLIDAEYDDALNLAHASLHKSWAARPALEAGGLEAYLIKAVSGKLSISKQIVYYCGILRALSLIKYKLINNDTLEPTEREMEEYKNVSPEQVDNYIDKEEHDKTRRGFKNNKQTNK